MSRAPPRSCDTIDHGVHGARKVAPLSVARRQGAVTFLGQLVHAAPAPVDLGPAAREQTGALETMEGRIERAFGKIERAVATGAERFRDSVAVRRLELDGGEEEQIEVALEGFGVHSS